eukprot:1113048-Alexandrium_andersonii.AAC.3
MLYEPIQWRGTTVVPVHKRKAPPSEYDSYRGVRLSNDAAKLYHAAFRTKVIEPYQQHASPGQR